MHFFLNSVSFNFSSPSTIVFSQYALLCDFPFTLCSLKNAGNPVLDSFKHTFEQKEVFLEISVTRFERSTEPGLNMMENT